MKKCLLINGTRQLYRKLESCLEEMESIEHWKTSFANAVALTNTGKFDLLFFDFDQASRSEIADLLVHSAAKSSDASPLLVLLVKKRLNDIPDQIWRDPSMEIIRKPLQKELLQKRIRTMNQLLTSRNQAALHVTVLEKISNDLHIAKQKIKIDQDEKDVLLQEVHHRVKNNLQIISSILDFNSRRMNEPFLREILQSTQSRVDTIALIHRKLYESANLAEINMQEYIPEQVNDIFLRFPEKTGRIRLNLHIDKVTLEVNRAIHCALLINELVVNAVLHAFPVALEGELNLKLSDMGNHYTRLEISDNGIGLPTGMNIQETESIGLRLVNQLVKRLEATLSIKSNHGTSFVVQCIRSVTPHQVSPNE